MSTAKTEKTDKTARTETEAPSFLKELYRGRFDESLVFPYPEIPEETKELVTAFADAYRDFDAAHIDSEKIDPGGQNPSRRDLRFTDERPNTSILIKIAQILEPCQKRSSAQAPWKGRRNRSRVRII